MIYETYAELKRFGYKKTKSTSLISCIAPGGWPGLSYFMGGHICYNYQCFREQGEIS
jgi:hypothetical protein